MQPATVALLHGCTQGPLGWASVVERLAARGIPSVVLDLPPERFSEADGTTCAQALAADLEPHPRVVLVGTSCSGAIVPLVHPLRTLEAIVYVCAAVPKPGASLDDQVFGDGLLHEDWLRFGDDPVGARAAREFMFNDVPEEDLPDALATVRLLHPERVYSEVFPLRTLPDVASHYVMGARDRIISQDWAMRVVPERLGAAPVVLDTGHCPQTSRPDLLADLLAGWALDPEQDGAVPRP